jgi:hypothetical protein
MDWSIIYYFMAAVAAASVSYASRNVLHRNSASPTTLNATALIKVAQYIRLLSWRDIERVGVEVSHVADACCEQGVCNNHEYDNEPQSDGHAVPPTCCSFSALLSCSND